MRNFASFNPRQTRAVVPFHTSVWSDRIRQFHEDIGDDIVAGYPYSRADMYRDNVLSNGEIPDDALVDFDSNIMVTFQGNILTDI